MTTLMPGRYHHKQDPTFPCWLVFGPIGGNAVYTVHNHSPEAAKTFAAMMAESCGWKVVYIQQFQGKCFHHADVVAHWITLRHSSAGYD